MCKEGKKIKHSIFSLINIVNAITDGIIITDPAGNIIRANNAIEKMLGYPKKGLNGKHASALGSGEDRDAEMVVDMITMLRAKGRVDNFETVFLKMNGDLCNVEYNISLIKNSDGNTIGAVSIVRDISVRKTMEQQLFQAEKLRSLGELAGGVAHDFNNALAAILGRAQLIKKKLEFTDDVHKMEKLKNEIKKGLETIEGAAIDAAETVRRIQEFSRKRNDDKYVGIADLNNILEGAVEFTKVRWKDDAEANEITYTVSVDIPQLPSIMGSTSELREVFINLINNALDAMPRGGDISITASIIESNIVIKVSDTGTGIAQTIADRIFDPFFTTKGPRSTGLGMSVSYGIIKRHRGIISIHSSENEGTTFIVQLPLTMAKTKKKVLQHTEKPAKKASILIVEDEKGVRDLISDLLVCEGHEVENACDGGEAIEHFKRRNFDIVFTDLGMPGISGWQVSKEIKKLNKNTPVILVTGWEVSHKKEEIARSGVDFIVNKPFTTDQILEMVNKGVEIRGRSSAIQ